MLMTPREVYTPGPTAKHFLTSEETHGRTKGKQVMAQFCTDQ